MLQSKPLTLSRQTRPALASAWALLFLLLLVPGVSQAQVACYRDADLDTWGDQGDTVQVAGLPCPAGYVELSGDCDDTASDVNPTAEEICNGVDNNCDTVPDNGIIPPPCALQQGVCGGSVQTCGGASGFLSCDSQDYGPSYEVSELTCDSLDNDCDGEADEGVCSPPAVPSMHGWGHVLMALILLGLAILSLVGLRPHEAGSD
jgi:hypothetical protein